jgi:hypothetical protein
MASLKFLQRIRDRNTKLLLEAGRLSEDLEESELCSAAVAEISLALGHLAEAEKALEKRVASVRASSPGFEPEQD